MTMIKSTKALIRRDRYEFKLLVLSNANHYNILSKTTFLSLLKT